MSVSAAPSQRRDHHLPAASHIRIGKQNMGNYLHTGDPGARTVTKDIRSYTPPQCGEGNRNNAQSTVVVAVDESEEATRAFEWYVREVHKPENHVCIVHCQEVEPPQGYSQPDYILPPEAWEQKLLDAQQEGLTLVHRYEARLNELKMKGGTYARVGRPGHVLVEVANELNACMIVMGTRGQGLLRRTILGSVSHYVVHHTHVPVTVVPSRKPTSIFF